jgi:hypothetical protein
MSNGNSGSDNKSRRRRRSSSSSKQSKKASGKDYTKVTGFGLVIFGIAMCMYSFGMFDNSSDLFHLPDFSDAIQLWPLFIVVAGFGFLIKDYLRKTNKQKWDS